MAIFIRNLLKGIGIGLLTGCLPAWAQQGVSVKATLDSTGILIGSQTGLTLEVLQAAGLETAFPPLQDTLTRSVEILDVTPIDTIRTEDGLMRMTSRLTVTSFDSGYHVLPPFAFVSRQSNGQTDTFLTNSLALSVSLVAVDTSQAIKPIKGVEELPLTLREALPWILGGLLGLALIGGLFYFFRNRKKPGPTTAKVIPKEPSHVVALRELDRLKGERLWQAGETKTYHSRLTDILRNYIERRFEIDAVEQTSDEILTSFREKGLKPEVPFDNLEELFVLADIVKFAKGKPKPDENVRSLESAYNFVEKTLRRKTESVGEE